MKNDKTGENECSCNRICTREYDPVCGTDGKTYSTECMMKLLVCEEGTDVTVKERGECPSIGKCSFSLGSSGNMSRNVSVFTQCSMVSRNVYPEDENA